MHDTSPKAVIELVQNERLTLLEKYNNDEIKKIETNHLMLLSGLADTALAQEKNQVESESNNTNQALLDVVSKVLNNSVNPFLSDGNTNRNHHGDLELPETIIIDGQLNTELTNYEYKDGDIIVAEE